MFGIGAGEFIVILIVGLIVFGPGKLPEVGRAIGKGLREFRKAQAALSATLNEPLDKEQVQNSKKLTADDVINMAKEKTVVKENQNEKIFNDNPNNVSAVDARASLAGATSSSNSSDKQPQPPTN